MGLTNECGHAAHKADTECQSLGIPASKIEKSGKYFFRVSMRTKYQEGDQDGEEPKYVQNKKRAFKFR